MRPPTAGEQPGEITWGEMFAVLPFGNRTVIETLTGAQMKTAFDERLLGLLRPVDQHRAIPADRRPPGAVPLRRATPAKPVIDGIWKTPNGASGPATPLGPADTVRFVTNDFMYTGGDGYTVFTQGTNVLQPGDDLLQVAIDYVTAHSPVAPTVDGRIFGP